ncbi:hypothetical protein PCL1606_48270 [Pseudomonas chlororaphis]|uniref:Uncharacterized protein n=1 Tax=Pseudomonas chlororaphis TaxID=587753 RepID=A0A0D5Y5I6_9PSED|nr:hypothetical protein PCL1606_48270 [Pseudomonas chlororaphis]
MSVAETGNDGALYGRDPLPYRHAAGGGRGAGRRPVRPGVS